MDEFTQAYIRTALWSSSDGSDESGGVPFDQNYDETDLAPVTRATMESDCAAFQAAHGHLFSDENCLRYGPDFGIIGHAGHDFWLTRCGHGAGFWDGDWKEPAATVLTDAAHAFGNIDLYLGDDGLIYGG